MAGRHAQAELPLQRRENTVRVAGGVFDLDLLEFLEPVQPGVALRQFQKTQLVAPLRHGERDVFPQASRWGERDDYLARELARQPLGDRPDRISQHVARRVFESRFQLDRERVDDRPSAMRMKLQKAASSSVTSENTSMFVSVLLTTTDLLW